VTHVESEARVGLPARKDLVAKAPGSRRVCAPCSIANRSAGLPLKAKLDIVALDGPP